MPQTSSDQFEVLSYFNTKNLMMDISKWYALRKNKIVNLWELSRGELVEEVLAERELILRIEGDLQLPIK